VALTILGILAVVALGAGLYLANKPQLVTVPDLKGVTAQQAEEKLAGNNLNGSPAPYAGDCTKDTVVDQNPTAGTQTNKGTTVTYQVCAGPETVVVPDVTKMKEADAENTLVSKGLTYGRADVDSDQPKGTVISTSPTANTSVAKGTKITVNVSLGDEAALPDVTGMTVNAAKVKLANAGFTNVKAVPQSGGDPAMVGKIVSEVPAAPKVIKFTDLVTIIYGQGDQNTSPSPSTSASASASPGQ
jgi:serine/threonine-protein kinase